MLKVEVKIFVGSVVSPAIGGWITLPMEKEQLKKDIKGLKVGEYIISDYQTELPIQINEYESPFEINEFVHLLKSYEKDGQLRLFLSAYLLRDENLHDTVRFLSKGNYRYFENVEDTESLGEAVVRSGALGFGLVFEDDNLSYEVNKLKENQIVDLQAVFQYLDFEKIGNDFECNGCRIYSTLKTAIMEIRATV